MVNNQFDLNQIHPRKWSKQQPKLKKKRRNRKPKLRSKSRKPRLKKQKAIRKTMKKRRTGREKNPLPRSTSRWNKICMKMLSWFKTSLQRILPALLSIRRNHGKTRRSSRFQLKFVKALPNRWDSSSPPTFKLWQFHLSLNQSKESLWILLLKVRMVRARQERSLLDLCWEWTRRFKNHRYCAYVMSENSLHK